MTNRVLLVTALVAVLALVACGGGNDDGGLDSEVEQQGDAMTKVTQCERTGEKSFASPPEMIIDPERTYTATIHTEKGDIVLELFAKDTPITTNNFVFLSCKGFYDGLTFHRVIPGFMAQGGDPTGTGAGGPGYTIPDEQDAASFDAPGMLSMGRSSLPNSAGSQFFITYSPQTHLDRDFTVFGRVTEGMEVLEQLTPRDPEQAPRAEPGDVIRSITIEES